MSGVILTLAWVGLMTIVLGGGLALLSPWTGTYFTLRVTLKSGNRHYMVGIVPYQPEEE